MKIELRKISSNKRLSQDSIAFHAEVWINGVKRGTAENSGHGGSTHIHPLELYREMEAYTSTLPPAFTGTNGKNYPQTPDWVVDRLLDRQQSRKDLTRDLKSKILFTVKGEKGVRYTKGKLTPERMTQLMADPKLRASWNVDKYLNELPEDEALELFMTP